MSKFFIGIIFLLTIFTHPVFAAPSLTISVSDPVTAGEDFQITFNLENLIIGKSYYLKAIGGENNCKVRTKNNDDYFSCVADWATMPSFTAEAESSARIVTAKFYDEISGDQQLRGRFREVNIEPNFDDSPELTINVDPKPPTPTPTPEPTSTPTPTPEPENTPEPTETPVPEVEPAEGEDCDGGCPLIGADEEIVTTSLADFPKQLQGPGKPLGPEKILGAQHEPEQDDPEKKIKSKSSKLIPTLLITVGLGIISYPIWQEIKKRRRIENPFKRKRQFKRKRP